MPKKGEYITFKNYERKIKSPFTIYPDFQSIPSPEDTGNENPNFINSMIEESKYCIDMIKKHFNKALVMTKEDNEVFENSTKC